MKRERWEEVDRLYYAALEREPATRASFLDEACAGDDELRREVASLLASDEQAGSFLAAPAVEIAARKLVAEPLPEFQTGKQPDPPAPRRIGAYQLLDPLGRGGMGEVHLALDTRLGRKVAIKLLPIEFTADAGRVRRFEQEARAASALCGETNQAKSLADELGKSHPEDTVINSIWLPSIRAAVELQRGDSTQAIEQLQTASRYEAAAEFWPQYLLGLALLKLRRGAEAAAEFQKILDHRGYAPLSPLYPLAYLGLARAATLTGETAKSRKAYEGFFAAWKEAGADLPILIDAKNEYERLK